MTLTEPRESIIAEVFSALDEAGVRWVLLRGSEGLGEEGRDVDLLVSGDHLSTLEKVIFDLGGVALPKRMHPWHRFYVLGGMRPGVGVKFDVVTELIFRATAPIHSGLEAGCLSRRTRHDAMYVLHPTHMFWTVLLHCVLDKRQINERRRRELAAVVDEVSRPSQGELLWEGLCPAGWSTERALESVRTHDWDALARLGEQIASPPAPAGTTRLRREWLGTPPARAARAAARSTYPVLWRSSRQARGAWLRMSELGQARARSVLGPPAASPPRRQVRVSFSGLDGAGKTRQIDALVSAVRDEHSVEVLWVPFKIWPESLLNRLPANFRSKLGPKRTTTAVRSTKATGGVSRPGVLSSVIWTLVGTLAAVSAGLSLRRRAAASRADLLVLDRYRLDTIVKLQFWYGDVPMAWLARLVSLIAPSPDVEFLLRVDAEVAYQRKPEQWSVRQLSTQAQLYDRLSSGTFPVVILDAHQPGEEIFRQVLSRVRSILDDA